MQELQKIIGYRFNNPKLLKHAMMHASYFLDESHKLKSNENLEFLGDRILAFVLSDYLFHHKQQHQEGYLAKMLSYLVSHEVLLSVGKKWNFYHLIYKKADKSDNDKIIFDAVEAIIAAVYLDANYDIKVVKEVILQHWYYYIHQYDEYNIYITFNPKSYLQDWSQRNQLGIPYYKYLSCQGLEHAPIFVVELYIKGYDVVQGQGKNKKAAQKDAATKFINLHNIKDTI